MRSVAIQLFREWLNEPASKEVAPARAAAPEQPAAPWLAITRRYMRPEMNHDLESMRSAVAAGWAAEAAGKLGTAGK